MSCLQHYRYQKAIALLLMVTVLTLLVLPVLIHIHHDSGFGEHDNHAIDYHMVLEIIDDAEHISHGDTHVIETSADFISKQSSDNLFKIAALLAIFLKMSLQTFSYYQRHYHSVRIIYQKHYSLSPPLRAPPL